MIALLMKSALVAALVVLPAFPLCAQSRVATVDLKRVFDNYWKTKEAEATLKERAGEMEKDLKNLIESYNKMKEEYPKLLEAANAAALSTEERERRKKTAESKLLEIRETEQTIEQYRRDAATRLDEQKRRMRENILKEIRTVLDGRAKSGGFIVVLDTSAETLNNTPVVLYAASGDHDLTDSVLQQLNAGARPSAPTDAGKSAAPPSQPKKK